MSIFHWDDYERVDYPLDQNSIVFDVGGFVGNWAQQIWDKYHCRIHIFEPVQEHVDILRRKFEGDACRSSITIHNVGLSNVDEQLNINVAGDRSSVFMANDGDRIETIQLVGAVEYIEKLGIRRINLMKINIEGGEYQLLERLISTDFIKNIDDIQVQFHTFTPDMEQMCNLMRIELAKTHHLTYQFIPWWENWRRNDA